MCGPLQVDLIGGNKYFVTFIDDFNQKIWTYLFKKIRYVFKVFTKFKSMVDRQSGQKIKTLKIDDGDEYISRDLYALCER